MKYIFWMCVYTSGKKNINFYIIVGEKFLINMILQIFSIKKSMNWNRP